MTRGATRLKYLAEITGGQSPDSAEVSDYEGTGTPFIQGNAEFGVESPTPRLRCDTAPRTAPEGSVLVSVRAPVGQLNIADRTYAIGRGLCAARATVGDGRFLWWAINSAIPKLRAEATGSTFEAVAVEDVASLEVPLWPLEEQRAIADFLDVETARIDALIDKKRRLITLLDERLRTFRDEWYSDLTSRFGSVRLRLIASSIDQGWSPVCDAAPAEGDDWGVLKTSSITAGFFRPEENKKLPDETEPDLRWKVSDRDLLLVRGSGSRENVGVACVARPGARNLTISDLIYRVGLAHFDPDFVATALLSSQVRSAAQATIRTDVGQTLKLRRDDIANMLVPNLPSNEQELAASAMASHADAHLDASDRLTRQIALLEEKRRALITAAVTGEFAVPGSAAA